MGDKHTKRTPPARPENGHGATPHEPSPELRSQIAALAEQVRRLSVREAPGAPAARDPAAPDSGALAAGVIALAEGVAEEIRRRAEQEARQIRAERRRAPSADADELFAVLRRQRAALAVLAAETERLEQSAEILRAQVRVLEAELTAAHEVLGTPQHPPVRDALSAPAA
jgi:hypothetical protein